MTVEDDPQETSGGFDGVRIDATGGALVAVCPLISPLPLR
jgi:hypothetical protein